MTKQKAKLIGKSMKPVKGKWGYKNLLAKIGFTIETARQEAYRAIDTELVKANWEIGRHIVEFEQRGNERADYGSELLGRLSKDSKRQYGQGFGRRNILDMRRFYLTYPIWQAVPAKLSWTHFITLMSVSSEPARKFYEKQIVIENWGYRELERQIDSSLFERLALSRDKKGILKLAAKGNIVSRGDETIRTPVVLDFLNVKRNHRMTEKKLEQKIIDNLQLFLLEMGKGFAFVARQFRIPMRNKNFSVDLVFLSSHTKVFCFD